MQRSIRWAVVVLALAAGAGLAAPASRAGGTPPRVGSRPRPLPDHGPGGGGRPTRKGRVRRRRHPAGRHHRDRPRPRARWPGSRPWASSPPGGVTARGGRWPTWPGPRRPGSGAMVWRRWDGPGGLRAEIDELAAAHPDLVRTAVIGHSVQGREIVAVRVTAGVGQVADGARPAVLYLSLQHAREWISGEVNRRLLRSLVTTYGTDPDATSLLDTTELWFVLVANPDGYERTFQPNERLWRKNAADNDHDGKIGIRRRRRREPELPRPLGLRARRARRATPPTRPTGGRAPPRSPRRRPSSPWRPGCPSGSWSTTTPSGACSCTRSAGRNRRRRPTTPSTRALAGTPVNPAIPGYKPQLSADLYPTNGETASWAHANAGALAFTVELGEGVPGSNFVFPDNEALIEQEYQLNRPFALDVARSAADPARPGVAPRQPGAAVRGRRVRRLLRRSATGAGHRPAPAGAGRGPLAGRAAGRSSAPRLWSGPAASATAGPATSTPAGCGARSTGTRPGDTVKVWFTAGGEQSDAFTYRVESHRGGRLLVVVGGEHRQRSDAVLGPSTPGGTARAGPGRPGGQPGRGRRLRRRGPRAGRPRPPRGARATTRPSCGRADEGPRAELRRPQSPKASPGWPTRRCWPPGTTSTRAAGCCTWAATPGASTPRAPSTTRWPTGPACPTPPGPFGGGRGEQRDRRHLRGPLRRVLPVLARAPTRSPRPAAAPPVPDRPRRRDPAAVQRSQLGLLRYRDRPWPTNGRAPRTRPPPRRSAATYPNWGRPDGGPLPGPAPAAALPTRRARPATEPVPAPWSKRPRASCSGSASRTSPRADERASVMGRALSFLLAPAR